MQLKRLVILANSRKKSGRCVAGVSLDDADYGTWIRPVSNRPERALNEIERWYVNKSEPKLLDVVEMPLIRAEPYACQVENWLVSTRKVWCKRGALTWDQALSIAEDPKSLWMNGLATFDGINNEIPTEIARTFDSSIGLIHVLDLTLEKRRDYSGERLKLYAAFTCNQVKYRMSVTDCEVEEYAAKNEFSSLEVGECLLTISLSEPFVKHGGESCQYKLVAAVMCKP